LKTLTSSFTTPKRHITFQLITIFFVFFVIFCPENLQNIISGVGILSFGILHGANDLKILSSKNLHKNSFFGISFLPIYIGVVLLGIMIFYFIPGIALLTFVMVSCYHFGEQHWNDKLDNINKPLLFYTFYGATIFLMLFSFHIAEVKNVIYEISSVNIPIQFFLSLLLLIGTISIIFMLYVIKNFNFFLIELMLLGTLAILFWKSSLLFGFGLYFVLWHSLPSLKSQIKYLYGPEEESPYSKYLKSAFLYWILALIGLMTSYFYGSLPKDQYLSIFFSFLAAITFPHVIVMGIMFHSHKNDSN
jgi:Brp/Blh family beta-carotene 15,15'-monooxygenase